MTNAEKFKEDWGFEPNVTHCPKCGRESCMVCPYAEKRFEECASDWWKSEYERTPMSDEELSKFIAEEMDKGSKLFKGAVCKVLEDVRAEITGNLETIIGKYDSNTKPEDMPSRKFERNNGRTEAIDIINRKMAEVTKHE